MIQATNNQQNLATALLDTQGEANAINPELMLENADFANELAASLSMDEALKVQPLELEGQQLQGPSGLINLPESGQPESVSPKIFDPSLTQGVEKLIYPKTTGIPANIQGLPEGVEIVPTKVDAEIAQAMLKTPQLSEAGRSPAINFAKAEVDPQLMSMEDFVAQKNMVSKKPVQTSAYGMNKGPVSKLAMESGLNSTQLVADASASAGAETGTNLMNSQQFILGLGVEQGTAKNAEHSALSATVKTFDMSQIKSSNPDQIMNQISDYIVQAKAAKEPTVNMRVNHDDLGIIDITVQKTAAIHGMNSESIAINIGAHSADGKNFFQMNSKELFSHLTNVGLNVSELKVETPTQTAKNDFDFNDQSRGGQGGDKQYNSESNQRRQESERRQDLWNLLKDKEAA